MKLHLFNRRGKWLWLRNLFVICLWLGYSRAQAQTTISPDPNHDGSQYMYPVRTWSVPERSLVIHPDHKGLSRDEELTAATRHKLENTFLPNVSLKDMPFSQAIERLRNESRRLNGSSEDGTWGVFIRMMPSHNLTAATPPDAPVPGLPPLGPDPSAVPEPKVCLSLGKTPVLEALRQVAAQADVQMQVGPGLVLFLPKGMDTSPLLTREFHVEPELLGLTTAKEKRSSPDGHSASDPGVPERVEAESFLKERGVTFPPGASASYRVSSGRLVITNTKENLDKIEALVNQSPAPDAPTPVPAHP